MLKADYLLLQKEFLSLSEKNSVEEIDSFGGRLREQLLKSERKSLEYNELRFLQDQLWDILFNKIDLEKGKN